MSHDGAPHIGVNGHGLRVVIVAGRWHEPIVDGLISGATGVLKDSGAQFSLVRVPGSFELSVVARAALEHGADAVVALGVIIRGGTPHFDYVSQAATSGLTHVAILTGKPVGFGVLTLDDEKQGFDRAGLDGSRPNSGAQAAKAALATAATLAELSQAE